MPFAVLTNVVVRYEVDYKNRWKTCVSSLEGPTELEVLIRQLELAVEASGAHALNELEKVGYNVVSTISSTEGERTVIIYTLKKCVGQPFR